MAFLSSDQLSQYKDKGYVAPIDIFTINEAILS